MGVQPPMWTARAPRGGSRGCPSTGHRRSDQARSASTTARAPRSPTDRRAAAPSWALAAALALGSRDPRHPTRHPRSVPTRPLRARTLCRSYARRILGSGLDFEIENWAGGIHLVRAPQRFGWKRSQGPPAVRESGSGPHGENRAGMIRRACRGRVLQVVYSQTLTSAAI